MLGRLIPSAPNLIEMAEWLWLKRPSNIKPYNFHFSDFIVCTDQAYTSKKLFCQPLYPELSIVFSCLSEDKGKSHKKTQTFSCFQMCLPCVPLHTIHVLKKTVQSQRISRQVQFPCPALPDKEVVTVTPKLPSPLPFPPTQVWAFLFLVCSVTSCQGLHVFLWKPFCLLSIFLHYLPVSPAFQYVFFSHPHSFYFIFSNPPSAWLSTFFLF